MVERKTLLLAGAGLAALLLVGAVAAIGPGDFLLPEESTTVNEPDDANGTVLKTGTFSGAAGHTVEGTVSLVRDEEGLYLRFEDYEQTQGPDVYVYVTPAESPTSQSAVSDGRKVRIDGGGDGGESTKEGTFTQRLPEGVDASEVNGVAVWCDQFATPFGSATLSADETTG